MNKPEYQASTAAGPLGGYVSQLMWALLALVKATNKNTRVGIEVLDDVSIKNGLITTLQQTKKTVHKEQSPFTDLNTNLWKTFSIWISYAKEQDPECHNTNFHLVTNADTKDNQLLLFFRQEKTEEKVNAFIEQVKILLKKTESKKVKANISKCISDDNIEIFKKILSKCSLKDSSTSSGSIMTDIYDNMSIPENADPEKFKTSIIGWFSKKVMDQIELNGEIWITKTDYIQIYANAVVECTGPKNIGSEHMSAKADEQYKQTTQDATYIKQLKLIKISKEHEVENALHDYYRFSLTRDQTINNAEVLADSWELEAQRLKEHWQHTSQIAERSADIETESYKIGQSIYNKCSLFNDLPKLNGNDREAFVVRGHFHVLADEEHIWWHPDYHKEKDK